MSLQPGQKLGPYAVLSSLGAGGMGEVYLAEDSRLGRQVAVKVLPQKVLEDQARRRRFLREARAAASVDHPNVVHVYDVGELPDGLIYLVMQHVEGKTVRKLIVEGQLEPERALTLAAEVADALSAAHQKGIIHRDIKPDNIMVDTSGHARVLDFGLALLLEEEPSGAAATEVETRTRKTTSAGSVLGTMAYMAPEQARGAEVDGRSDIFSLGVTLYEMLSRRHPFAGKTDVATVDSLLHKDPRPVGSLVGGLPPETEWVISKMMAKKPEDRYQGAGDLLVDLRKLRQSTSISGVPAAVVAAAAPKKRPSWLMPVLISAAVLVVIAGVALTWWARAGRGGGSAAPEAGAASVPTEGGGTDASSGGTAPAAAVGRKIRLAVLPLQNVSGDKRVEFLGYALADATISKLSYLKELTVRPSSFIQRYRENPPEDPQAVGRDLNVDHLLTGSLLTQGDTLRVNVQYVDLTEGAVAWEETIDSKVDNLLNVQDEVVSRIVDRMRLKVSPDEQADLARDRAHNQKAFDLYLRAVSQPDTPEGRDAALGLLNQSMALEDDFAPAWVELGHRKYDRALYSSDSRPGDYDEALQAMLQAEKLNPESPQMNRFLIVLLTERGRTEEAYRRATGWLARHPEDAAVHYALSYIFRYVGLLDDGAREAELALSMDPGNPFFRSGGILFAYLGDMDRAEAFFSLDDDSGFSLSNRLAACAVNGMSDEAKALVDEELQRNPDHPRLNAGMIAWARGDMKKAREILANLTHHPSKDPETRYNLGAAAARMGLTGPALDLIRSAVEGGFYCTPLLERDKRLDPIRDNPEFQKILARSRERTEAFRKFVEASR